jgi:uncharacterized membrane protein (UPF0136 family)
MTIDPKGTAAKVADTAAKDVAMISNKADPYTHYAIAGACMTAAYFAHQHKGDVRTSYIAGLFGLAFGAAGYYIGKGNTEFAYQLGLVSGVGLLAMTAPRAISHGDNIHVALAALGGVSAVANGVKAFPEKRKY